MNLMPRRLAHIRSYFQSRAVVLHNDGRSRLPSLRQALCASASCLLFVSACAATAKDSPQKPEPIRGSDCLFFSALYDWQELDHNNLVIWSPGRRDAYQIYVAMPLYDLSFSVQLAFVDKDHDGQLCGFSRDEIAIVDRTFPQHSSITAMKKLQPQDMADLEARYKVKLTSDSRKKKPKQPDAATSE